MRIPQWFTGLIRSIGLIMGLLVLMGCFTFRASAAPEVSSYARVVHAAPGAGNVDVFVDGKSLLSNFAFGTVSKYVQLSAGQHKVQVAPTGKGAAAAVITQSVTATAGQYYTYAALGTAASSFSLKGFEDNNKIASDVAGVRVYHLSPNAGPVDVAASGKKLISALTYTNASNTLTVPAGAYTFDVTATKANAKVPVATTLKAGTVNSVFALGLLSGTPALKFIAATVPAAVPASK